jgi:hypothetical protein
MDRDATLALLRANPTQEAAARVGAVRMQRCLDRIHEGGRRGIAESR